MLKEKDRTLRTLLLGLELACCAEVFSVWVESAAAPGIESVWTWAVLGVAATLSMPLVVRGFDGTQTRFDSLFSLTRNLVYAASTAGVIIAALAFVLRAPVSPVGMLGCIGAQFLALGTLRLGVFTGLRVLRRSGRNYRNIVVLGTGPRALEFTETVERNPQWGIRLVGYVDDADVPLEPGIVGPVFKMTEFTTLLRDEVFDEVIAACPRSMLSQIGPAVQACCAAGIPLTVLTDLFGDYLPAPQVRQIGSRLTLSFAPIHHDRTRLGVKRAIDIVSATLGLLIAAPVVALSAIAIKLSSRGPVFFQQQRCGLYGRPFKMIKLRTMVTDAEERRFDLDGLNEMDGPVFKMQSDPRVTPVGRLLRTFSIDELPQFWNVLTGDMSLVGPRPPLPHEVVQYEMSQRRRLSMRPGLTCLWQVSGRNALNFEEWVKLDLEYIDSWSLGNDIRILLATVPTVLRGTGS